ncbi:helix-turn-helix domain-containing protein [Companilactobacillus mishanensis]|uniref:Helix-turn-helix transcriptional regulator n=1 Tax=Companilactobacillus mishanensis TaxID=2486008 RepID=A0A5P0ZEZ1_9LACO|nr:helix-turn-helix transcriptional regulator [Companilactobacillus mishanensis]MQS44281.1 helix-turn-helix transcriptional regulator [Companilactobacillus mishanensis]MQS51616.1 helix-turn-helix transcriptional regulator [Companilactobacillus mishanensis]
MTELGERIRSMRMLRKLKVSDVSSSVNESVMSVSLYERGKRTPEPNVLKDIARTLNTTTGFLLGSVDAKRTCSFPTAYKGGEETTHTIEKEMLDLTEEDKKQVLDFIGYIKSR